MPGGTEQHHLRTPPNSPRATNAQGGGRKPEELWVWRLRLPARAGDRIEWAAQMPPGPARISGRLGREVTAAAVTPGRHGLPSPCLSRCWD